MKWIDRLLLFAIRFALAGMIVIVLNPPVGAGDRLRAVFLLAVFPNFGNPS